MDKQKENRLIAAYKEYRKISERQEQTAASKRRKAELVQILQKITKEVNRKDAIRVAHQYATTQIPTERRKKDRRAKNNNPKRAAPIKITSVVVNPIENGKNSR
ncbi:hypothetical protein [Haloactinomyces albus]|uniref:Uncharacterized protein n=1 Tax=Haloactinomyces albus TaxID=1352928 RepID=A0AAE3ZFT9_9ACTN|nr:hypothetical protein [Haloactinomyces albus]MDR7304158.1 hypothetical protein [Haloactinomyces albus]